MTHFIRLHLVALSFVFLGVSQLRGQENSSQILARGQVATLPTTTDRSTQHADFPLLSPGGGSSQQANRSDRGSGENELLGPAVTVGSSLVVVLGLFAAMVWLTRRLGSRNMAAGAIPNEIIEGLGSTSIDPRTTITMVRLGNRILVMAVAPTGVHPLCEIDDPEEVRQLTAACLGDSKRAFASALKSIEKENVEPGYAGSQPKSPRPQRGRLFATA